MSASSLWLQGPMTTTFLLLYSESEALLFSCSSLNSWAQLSSFGLKMLKPRIVTNQPWLHKHISWMMRDRTVNTDLFQEEECEVCQGPGICNSFLCTEKGQCRCKWEASKPRRVLYHLSLSSLSCLVLFPCRFISIYFFISTELLLCWVFSSKG